MVKENQEDDLKNKEQEKSEGLPEIEPNKETSDGIMKKGQQDVAIIEAGIEEEIGGMEKTAETHNFNPEELLKVHGIEENIKKGVDEAKGNLEKDIEPLKISTDETELIHKCSGCGDETQHGKYCTKCGTKLLRVGKQEISKKSTSAEFDKLFEEIIAKVEIVKNSKDSNVEKLKKLEELLDKENGKVINLDGINEFIAAGGNQKKAGEKIVEIMKEISVEIKTGFENELSNLQKKANDLEKAPIDSFQRIDEAKGLLKSLEKILNDIDGSGEGAAIKRYPQIKEIGNLLYNIQERAEADKKE